MAVDGGFGRGRLRACGRTGESEAAKGSGLGLDVALVGELEKMSSLRFALAVSSLLAGVVGRGCVLLAGVDPGREKRGVRWNCGADCGDSEEGGGGAGLAFGGAGLLSRRKRCGVGAASIAEVLAGMESSIDIDL